MLNHFIKRAGRYCLALFLFLCLGSSTSYGWSLKTHIWIGQQVLNDVLDDGMIHIGRKQYPVPAYIVDALRTYPQMFRAGNLGPDIYPDPIVGQITTHPGLDGGWRTDQWLAHLLHNSQKPQDIALAFGFMCHAAGDMFAHTYVNNYAGDVFSLLDNERDVELRHFVLEKYIERATPHPRTNEGRLIDWQKDIRVSEAFIAERLILNEAVFKQYTKSGTGLHLSAMYGVKAAVNLLDEQTNKLINELTKWGARYYKAHAKLMVDMATGKTAIQAAQANVEIHKLKLKADEAVWKVKLAAFEAAKNTIQQYPELITYNEQLYIKYAEAATVALENSTKVAVEVNQIVGDFENQVRNFENKLAGEVCKVIKKVPVLGKIMSSGCKEIDKLRSRIRGVQADISGQRQREIAARVAAENAAKLRDETKDLLDKFKAEYEKAVKGLAEGTYKKAVDVAEATVKSQRIILAEAEEFLQELEETQARMQGEFDIVSNIIDKIKELADKYNAITLLVGNWNKGITRASEEFILAGNSAGYKLLVGEGNPMDDYKRWYACYGAVFTGIPYQGPEAACFVLDNLGEIKKKYDELISDLPEILQWAINPTKKAQDLAYKQLEPALKKAAFEFTKYLTDQKSAEFLQMLTGQSHATREKLNQVYGEDQSGKKLLLFTDVYKLVDKDLALADGLLNPQQFYPLAHSVTMAKLAILDAVTINQVIRDLAGEYTSPFYGSTIYQPQGDRFSILLGVLGSIDGNHQWQAYALPYPRRVPNAKLPEYGYDYYKDNSKGLKIWVDPYLRERVFTALFPGSVLGALGERPELQWPTYKFPECMSYLFPTTQEAGGGKKTEDGICRVLWNPNQLPSWMVASQPEFKVRYHQCDTIIWGDKHWTIVGSYYDKDDADAYRKEVEKKYPDLFVNIAEQQSGQKFWTVMLSSCTDSIRAHEAKNIAIRRRIAADAYVWKNAEVFRTEPRAANRRRRNQRP